MLVVRTRFCDQLAVSAGTGTGTITLNVHTDGSPLDIPPEQNLCYRAAHEFLRKFDLSDQDISIDLTKHIPAGAGLGGGSSDAGETLLALQKLFCSERQIREADIQEIALGLGSDIPFFLQPHCAQVSGVGDVVRPLDLAAIEDVPCALFFPGEHISSALIYSKFREAFISGDPPSLDPKPSSCVYEDLSYSEMLPHVSNDLEATVCEAFPLTKKVLWTLRQECAHTVSITGSGSTVFVLPETDTENGDFERQIQDIAERNDFHYLLTSLTCKCSAVSPL